MDIKLIHIVPLDIGCSFHEFEYNKKQNKKEFIAAITEKARNSDYSIIEECNRKQMLTVKLNDRVTCVLLEYGVGVFIIKNLDFPEVAEMIDCFSNQLACKTYYRKKYEQTRILAHDVAELDCVEHFMQMVWSTVKNITRPYSANVQYKHKGLPYVLKTISREKTVD